LSSGRHQSSLLDSSDEPTNKSAAQLADTLLDPEWGHSNAPEKSPFNYALGTDLTLWHYFEGVCLLCLSRDMPIISHTIFQIQQKKNPKAAEQGARFERGMIGKSLANDSLAILTGL